MIYSTPTVYGNYSTKKLLSRIFSDEIQNEKRSRARELCVREQCLGKFVSLLPLSSSINPTLSDILLFSTYLQHQGVDETLSLRRLLGGNQEYCQRNRKLIESEGNDGATKLTQPEANS